MATCADDFEEWLCTKLKALNTDQDVFSTYIRGILEGDEPNDDKLEALEGILFEIETDSMVTLSQEILDKWNLLSHVQNDNVPLKLDIDAQLASIMEKQAQSVVTERKLTVEEKQYREAILAQYSHVSENEDSDEDETVNPGKEVPVAAVSAVSTATTSTAANPSSAPVNGYQSLSKNTNAEDVFKAEKDKRDKAKAESEKKKAADKANKEKQKQQQQERKEKEKKRTQKGERKR